MEGTLVAHRAAGKISRKELRSLSVCSFRALYKKHIALSPLSADEITQREKLSPFLEFASKDGISSSPQGQAHGFKSNPLMPF
jgi:hypothetical protein